MKFRVPGLHEWTPIRGWTPFGAPVFLHITALVAFVLLVALTLASPIHGLLAIGCYFAIILGHELGHAFVAHRLGYRVHGIAVTAWHGWCETTAPKYEWDDALIAWGGVGAQLVMAIPGVLLAVMLGGRDWGYLTSVIVILGFLNPAVAAANLLPGELCDGSTAWRIVPLLLERRRTHRERKAWQARAGRKRT